MSLIRGRVGLQRWSAAALFLFVPVLLVFVLQAAQAQAAGLPDFTGLVKETAPAVVKIETRRQRRQVPQQLREEVPDFLRRFFQEQQPQWPQVGTGSGFILSEDGYILTNHHVVDGAEEVIVRLLDRRELEAEVVGNDPLSDLALLKVDAEDLPMVELGNSAELQVGEWVFAIGSPFDFEYSVTAGIVSARGRSLATERSGSYVPYIQTDVAINPGNSGGPLFDLQGRVVGINSQIVTRNGGYMGLSFAIPIDVAMEVVNQLRDNGSVSRGWLGVLIQQVNRELAESFGLDRPAGALVSQVFADSPAAAAGLREGDIILEFDGRLIDLSGDLPHVVGRTPADKEVEVRIFRDGQRKSLTVVIGELDESRLAGGGGSARNDLGLVVEELDEEVRTQLNIDSGVRVVRVGNGPAREAGIRRGDILLLLNQEPVESVAHFAELVAEMPHDRAVPAQIIRGGRRQFVTFRIE